MARLELEHVAAGYVEGIDILGDITLRVEPGSITGVIGPNGAGKSTLLKTIFGFLHPRRGTIALDGRADPRPRALRGQAPRHQLRAAGGEHLSPAHGGGEPPARGVGDQAGPGAGGGAARGRLHGLPAPAREAAPARHHALGRRGQDALSRQGARDRADPPSRGRAVGGAGSPYRRAGLRPAPRGTGAGGDHPARGPEHQQGRSGLRLPLHDRARGSPARRARAGTSPISSTPSCATRSWAPERMSPLARRIAWSLLAFAALAWLPLAVSEYHTHILIISLYYVILAASWNLLAGYAGQFSLAHHTFAGIGAYTSALLGLYAGVPILVGIGAGVVAAAIVGYGLGHALPSHAGDLSRPRHVGLRGVGAPARGRRVSRSRAATSDSRPPCSSAPPSRRRTSTSSSGSPSPLSS